MKAEIKKQWIADLKSGNFEQCTENFKSGDAYDALGLLILQYNRSHPHNTIDIETVESFPSVVSLWAGITPPTFESPVSILDVMELNDAGHPFADLAEFVECNFE